MRKYFLSMLLLLGINSFAQMGEVKGVVKSEGQPMEFVQVFIKGTNFGTVTNYKGKFSISKIPFGKYRLTASFVGYKQVVKSFVIDENHKEVKVNFNLSESSMTLEEVVVTGTKTAKRQTNSPVIVNVVNSQTLNNIQASDM